MDLLNLLWIILQVIMNVFWWLWLISVVSLYLWELCCKRLFLWKLISVIIFMYVVDIYNYIKYHLITVCKFISRNSHFCCIFCLYFCLCIIKIIKWVVVDVCCWRLTHSVPDQGVLTVTEQCQYKLF